MNKRPSFQFYPADWVGDINVATMTEQEEGIYIRLICYCWMHGSFPSDIDKIKRLLKDGHNHNATTLEPILRCFICNESGDYIHKRLEKERQKQDEWRAKSSRGGIKSAEKRKNKQDLKGGSSLVDDCLQPKGNTSSSSSSSSSSSKKNKPFVHHDPDAHGESSFDYESKFDEIWKRYPEKKGRHVAKLKFKSQVKTDGDWLDIQKALKNYEADVEAIRNNGHPDRKFQNGATWFNSYWRDYINLEPEKTQPAKKPWKFGDYID